MEYAAGGSLTAYVSQRWQHATHTGLFLGEDEARYFFRVSYLKAKLHIANFSLAKDSLVSCDKGSLSAEILGQCCPDVAIDFLNITYLQIGHKLI